MNSNTTPRFMMIGGFLGAGKTTTLSRLARHFQSRGLRVVIVTNDQATDLVDTNLLRAQGFTVGEVAGSCFCCNFDGLTSTMESLSDQQPPDVVLAEPVGSCTDLVATVLRPLEKIYDQPFDISPYGVILKPSHGLKILTDGQRGFSAEAAYIFRKQLEEADFIVLNRIDELKPAEVDKLQSLLEQQYPGRPVVRFSAASGEGIDSLLDALEPSQQAGTRTMEVDYDIYAVGEAELGWLNANAHVEAKTPFELDSLVMTLIDSISQSIVASDSETAHLKLIGTSGDHFAVANHVSNQTTPMLSVPSRATTKKAQLVINARVALDPESLTRLVRDATSSVSQSMGLEITIERLQSFRPGRPVPTHRLVANT
jgi:G3E family GTPase